MNPDTLDEAKSTCRAISKYARISPRVVTVIAPPYPFLAPLQVKSNVSIVFAAQDISRFERGAHTSLVSARQVKSSGAEVVIVGHSERRAAGDTDEIVSEKVRQAIDAGLDVVLCVGEKQRDDQAHYLREIREQLFAVFAKLESAKASRVMLAYEPVWAIGKSYDTALKPHSVHEMSIYIKKVLSEIYDKKIGLKFRVLYGGSVDFENAKAILSDGAIDGLLVGRQSLDPKAFGSMISYANGI